MYVRLSKRVNTAREDGFTLIELLIVIVILGILAGIVVFAVGTARDDAEDSACSATEKSITVAIEAYKAKTGKSDATNAILTGSSTATGGPYLKDIPTGWTIAGSAITDKPDECA